MRQGGNNVMATKKKDPIMLKYAGQRIRIDAIASYFPMSKRDAGRKEIFGIKFITRSGEHIAAAGDDKKLRDNVLTWLDKHFNVEYLPSRKCNVCANPEAQRDDIDCGIRCYAYQGFPKYVRPTEG